MKRIFKVIILLILLIPIKTYALTGSVNLECTPEKISPNNNVTCKITGQATDGEVTGLSMDLRLSENISLVSFEASDDWQGDASENKIGLYTSSNKKDNFNIGTLVIKVKDSTTTTTEVVSLVNVIFANETFEEVSLSSATKSINITSSNNFLSSLSTNIEQINFDKNRLEYNIEVDADTIIVSATAEDKNAKVTGNVGTIKLSYGKNILKINVTNENNETRVYTINVTRKDYRSTNNFLAALTIEKVSLPFRENIFIYNVSVENDIEQVKVSAALQDSKSRFVNNYGPRTVPLKEGTNEVLIKIEAENGSVQTYKINIVRKETADNKKDDTSLKNIIIDNKMLDAKKEENKYTIPYDTDKIDIKVTPSSNKSKVEIIGNDNLQVGENIITIKVTAEDGTTKEYKIIVTKKNKGESLDDNNYLKKLEVENYDISFNKDTLNYTIKIGSESSLNINCILSSDKATYVIEGNNNLKNNSVVKIIVTAENNETRTYNIHIEKQTNYLMIVIIVETLLIIAILSYMMLKKKRDNNEET